MERPFRAERAAQPGGQVQHQPPVGGLQQQRQPGPGYNMMGLLYRKHNPFPPPNHNIWAGFRELETGLQIRSDSDFFARSGS